MVLLGKDQVSAWHLPVELQHFKETTMGPSDSHGKSDLDGMKMGFTQVGPALPNARSSHDPENDAGTRHAQQGRSPGTGIRTVIIIFLHYWRQSDF